MTMTSGQPSAAISARLEQRTYPPYDPLHGTNEPMLWRRVQIDTPAGTATFEQTDYGHAGRLNPWEPRGIAPALLPRQDLLRSVAAALASAVG